MDKVKNVEKNIKTIVEKYHGEKSSLIAMLQDIQKEYNFLPKDTLKLLSEETEIPLSRIYEVSTYYNSFSLTPQGRYLVQVCAGTACHIKGAPKLLSRLENELNIECGETTENLMFTLKDVRCLGCCSLAPVIKVDDHIHAYLTEDEIQGILENFRK